MTVRRETIAEAAVEASLSRITASEEAVRAWAFLDPELARRSARTAPAGPLAGVTVGVKDLFDTVDYPAEFGSVIYSGCRPGADAAAVALLRAAGAVVVGKTVTAELGWFTPGPTHNPHRSGHTPGGSSSGSAAAVAAGMVDLALGTQTAGSVIRPASYCGVWGYKATFGTIPTAGVKQAAPSLDTVGAFARNLSLLDTARMILTGRDERYDASSLRFSLIRTQDADGAGEDSRAVVERAAAVVDAVERPLPAALVRLAADQPIVQAFEGSRSLAWERSARRDQLSPQLRELLDWGEACGAERAAEVLVSAAVARLAPALDELFGDADVLVTPAVDGEAPAGLHSTGDPRWCRLWTLLGFPAISAPCGAGKSGLPIGVQLVGKPHQDARLFAAAAALADELGCIDIAAI